ncbi:Uncharacterized protein Adt_20397 [Abeliophyllum distichum]|uniref:Uncharacterized protein n=1 Tax=Abeliophyllum distichum TaxID=126358 RepID=A0ABD1SWG9_9LAMI
MNVIILDSSPERQDTISLSDIEFSFDSLESIEPLEQLDSSLPEVSNSYLCTSQALGLVTPGRGIEPSVDIFRLLFEMKPLDRYDCFVVFSHRDRGIPAHKHFKIPNCPTSNSGWKSRYFFVKPVDEEFNFPLNWGIPPFEDFNSTPILTESEIDYLIMLRAIAPLGRSMNNVLTDDALVSAGIGRPYGRMSYFSAFETDLHCKTNRLFFSCISSFYRYVCRISFLRTSWRSWRGKILATVGRGEEKTSLTHRNLIDHEVISVPVDSRQSDSIRRPIEKVVEDCQAVISCLDWELIEASKDKSPESLERSIMVEERCVDPRSEKNELLVEREARIAEVESLLTEKEDLLQQSNQKVESLQENINRLESELVSKGESAVEAYKSTDEYMTTVGMVRVHGREMAFRKSREWLTERFPNLDFSGAPFMPFTDDEDEDEDD